MTFGLALCGACGRPRVLNRSNTSSTCPYCGCSERTSRIRIVFESEDPAEVRSALAGATSRDEIEALEQDRAERRRRAEDDDPYSTLVFRYEHSSDMDERMDVMAEGLTRLKGDFTLDDMMEMDPRRAERMLPAMLSRGYIHEVRPGHYRARFNPFRMHPASSCPPCG